jgi:hypothetical protein
MNSQRCSRCATPFKSISGLSRHKCKPLKAHPILDRFLQPANSEIQLPRTTNKYNPQVEDYPDCQRDLGFDKAPTLSSLEHVDPLNHFKSATNPPINKQGPASNCTVTRTVTYSEETKCEAGTVVKQVEQVGTSEAGM